MEYPLQILTALLPCSVQVTQTVTLLALVLGIPADGRVLPEHGSKQIVLCMLDERMFVLYMRNFSQDHTDSYFNDLCV